MIPEPTSSANENEEVIEGLADQIRAGLEYRVLELIITAYNKMHDDKPHNPQWKENKFTAVLKNYVKKDCQRFSKLTRQSWYIIREYYHDSEGVTSGDDDPDKSPRIDIIIVTWTAEYEEIKFPFECKLLDENNSDLIRLYVKKGLIDRYLTEKDYADKSFWGGMIGYILTGDPDNIVNKINLQIEKQLADPNAYLRNLQPVNKLTTIYFSLHQRSELVKSLRITHLLFSFA